MFHSQFLLQKQRTRRSKITTLSQSLINMENLVADQQLRIEELESFIMWIYDVSSKGRENPQNNNIINAIENFHSGTLMSSVIEKDEEPEDIPYSSQRNLTFFPVSAASSVSKDQTFSMQSVPMNQSQIKQIQFSESSRHSNLAGCTALIRMAQQGILKSHNKVDTPNTPKK